MLIGYLRAFFGEVSSNILHTLPFKKNHVVLLSCMSSLYILDTSLLLDTSFKNIFFQSVAFLFIFSTEAFNFYEIKFIICFLLQLVLFVSHLRNHYLTQGYKDFPLSFLLEL